MYIKKCPLSKINQRCSDSGSYFSLWVKSRDRKYAKKMYKLAIALYIIYKAGVKQDVQKREK
jgi:hypothetical protein